MRLARKLVLLLVLLLAPFAMTVAAQPENQGPVCGDCSCSSGQCCSKGWGTCSCHTC
jgi:hypothetical protein